MTPFWATWPDEWSSFVDVNLYGVLNVCRHGLRAIIAQNDGAAAFTRSIAKSVAQFNVVCAYT
jgi:NADP-dependent 3-hydroxy acid dehydrogenase YdfG